MSQIHMPFLPTRRERAGTPPPFLWWVDVLIFAILIAIAYGIVVAASRWIGPFTPTPHIDLSPGALPLYAGLSTLRMA
ncbi:MAG TPA: hypothetical protein VFQ32_01725, partial [Ktedonobacterales bacterium]|nr:hypothetical protein [Ktedonobacterales bacterium]